MELFTYQYDPIKIFESNSTYTLPVEPEVEVVEITTGDVLTNT